MALQSIFQAGNSSVVAIPTDLLQEMHLKVGQKVVIQKMSDDAIVIHTNPAVKKSKSIQHKEFEKWLQQFIEEDKELLIELSNR